MCAKPHIIIDLTDVVRAGGVEQAIIAWCAESGDTSCGEIGSTFSTSGPGSGWTVRYGVEDYCVRAIEGGATHYVDESDGRMISAEECAPDEDGAIRDQAGMAFRLAGWTRESVVRLECPPLEDAAEHPAVVAAMARAVIDHHGAVSERREWQRLVIAMQAVGEAAADLDAADLD